MAGFDMYDYAGVSKDKKLQRLLMSYQETKGTTSLAGIGKVSVGNVEEVLFSDLAVKVNRKGKRQNRVLMVTNEAVYNFKHNVYTKPMRRIPLQAVEALLLSAESSSMVIFHVRDEYDYKYETLKRPALVRVMNIIYRESVKKDLEVMMLSNSDLEEAFVTKPQMAKFKEQVAKFSGGLRTLVGNQLGVSELLRLPAATNGVLAATSTFSSLNSPTAAAVNANNNNNNNNNNNAGGSISPANANNNNNNNNNNRAETSIFQRQGLTNETTNSGSPSIRNFLRKSFSSSPTPPAPKYQPVCPTCSADLGVCQSLWSLVERAHAPLVDEPDTVDPGLIRCADILVKLVGKNGPSSSSEAIRAVAALCFDHDAARALVKSMDDNIPVLGGAALIDSLDALQRCEDWEVRKWAIKSLWKLLPMCMSENIMPTTSQKWMSALSGSQDPSSMNTGEAAFIRTFFHGPILPPDDVNGRAIRQQNQGLTRRPPSKRADRKGSFSLLGASFRNSTFPTGLSYLMVQQAFAHILLQNMFDLQRRATYVHIAEDGSTYKNEFGDDLASPRSKSAMYSIRLGTGDPYSVVVRGVEESDCDAVIEIMLGTMVAPTEKEYDRRIESLGKRIRNNVLLPTLMGMLTLIQSDSVRSNVLKEVSLLLLRSEMNLKNVLAVPNWQMIFIPLLQSVPSSELSRTPDQQQVYRFVLNLVSMIHTYCFKDPICESGPLLNMIGTTFKCSAIFSGWGSSSVSFSRWILLALLSQLAMTSRHWWHNPEANEWDALLQVLRAIETFIFALPVDEANQFAETIKRSSASNGGGDESPQKEKKKNAVDRLIRESAAGSESFSMSDNEDDDDLDNGQSENLARAFSVTPLYVLNRFDPVMKPLSPSKLISLSPTSYSWITDRIGKGSLGETPLALKSLDDVQNGKPGYGLHFSPTTGLCADRELIQKAIQLLRSQGITGDDAEDQKKRNQIKSANRKYKGLLKQASEWCSALRAIEVLLKGLDESTSEGNEEMCKGIMAKLNVLISTRHKAGAKVSKITSTKGKTEAHKIEASIFQQRALAKQKLEKHKNASKKATRPSIVITSSVALPKGSKPRKHSMVPGQSRRESFFHRESMASQKSPDMQPQRYSNLGVPTSSRKSSNMARLNSRVSLSNLGSSSTSTMGGMNLNINNNSSSGNNRRMSAVTTISRGRFYSSVTDNDEGPAVPSMPELGSPMDVKGKQSIIQSIHEDAVVGDIDLVTCVGCNRVCDDDFETVEKFGQVWHVDCFRCDNCTKPILKMENQDESLFFDDPELRLFCSATCREVMLDKFGKNMCPGCMCTFIKGERVVEGCGRQWHAGHFRCFDCKDLLGVGTKKEYYENDGWPFCEPCHLNRFKTCNKCNQPIHDKDDAVDALGFVWHRTHFGCFKCGESFADGQYYVDGKGDQRRAYCQKHYLSLFDTEIKCAECLKVVTDKESAVSLGEKVYHLQKCFSCHKCKVQLKPGAVHEENGSPYCPTCWTDSYGFKCTGCSKPIAGDVLHSAENEPWHPECFVCSECDGHLGGRYVVVSEGSKKIPMCETHYYAKFSKMCAFCRLEINDPKELVETQGKFYHKNCLLCSACARPLIVGGSLELHTGPDSNFYCKEHEFGVCALQGCSKPAWTSKEYFKSLSDGLFYCQQHRNELDQGIDGDICAKCFQSIGGDGLATKTNKHYHQKCFTCTTCSVPFKTGEAYVEKENGPIHAKKCD